MPLLLLETSIRREKIMRISVRLREELGYYYREEFRSFLVKIYAAFCFVSMVGLSGYISLIGANFLK